MMVHKWEETARMHITFRIAGATRDGVYAVNLKKLIAQGNWRNRSVIGYQIGIKWEANKKSNNNLDCTPYFVEAPLAEIIDSSLLGNDATSLAHLYLCNFSHSSLQILSSYFEVSPDLKFDQVQFRALAGPLKDIHRLVLKPLLCCLGCVLGCVVAMLEGELLPQFGVLSLFSLRLSVLCSVHLSLDSHSSHSYCCWKTSPQHDAAPTMLHRRDGIGDEWCLVSCRSDTWHSGQRVQSWYHQTRLVSHGLIVWESFRCLLANSKWAVMCFLLRSGFHLATIKAWLVECCRDGCPSGKFSHLHRGTGALSKWPLGSWSPPWPRPLSPQLLSFARQSALGRVLEVPNFFHLRMMRPLCSSGTSMLQIFFFFFFFYSSPDMCLDTILPRSSTDNSFNFMAWYFFSDMHCQLWDLTV